MADAVAPGDRVDALLDRARQSIPTGSGAPVQVALRRAVSDAYYAAFHFVTDRMAVQLLGTATSKRAARQVLTRAFSHSDLKDGCKKLSSGPLTGRLAAGLPAASALPAGSPLPEVPTAVVDFAVALISLQERRHAADYNWNQHVTKRDALQAADDASQAIAGFREIPSKDPGRQWFLAALAVWSGLRSR